MRAAAKRGDISPQTWSDLEKGVSPPSGNTQRGVARALGWGVDWYDAILAGGEPTEVRQPDGDDVLRRLERLEALVETLRETLTEGLEASRYRAEVEAAELDASEDWHDQQHAQIRRDGAAS